MPRFVFTASGDVLLYNDFAVILCEETKACTDFRSSSELYIFFDINKETPEDFFAACVILLQKFSDKKIPKTFIYSLYMFSHQSDARTNLKENKQTSF